MLSLAQRLRAETQELHAAAERSALMAMLMRGTIEAAAYGALLRNLYEIYAALEPALLRQATHPLLAAVVAPELQRLPALVSDLAHLCGARWRHAIAAQPAALAYARRLRAIDDHRPGLLLAHAYVRYLGDLSGGQLLGPRVSRALALADDRGTAFYRFGDDQQTARLTASFRSALSGIEVDAATGDAIVAEARLAFQMHCELFEALAAR